MKKVPEKALFASSHCSIGEWFDKLITGGSGASWRLPVN